MMNNTINEIKNSLKGISSRITEAEEWIRKDKKGLVRKREMMEHIKVS